ncbi:uncharacterized protein LOC121390385 isoform X2 [Gigantopelta aegis]|uniref:uncharacterized protein LOC121390385 isoform X2 n=1 Tax=Gigantopelta aegis TaxID=1735272 RepID=UPI001B88BCF4|nr:uncharacterized protein LOC121390385 isoform X2 [Gigantopelta aegis]
MASTGSACTDPGGTSNGQQHSTSAGNTGNSNLPASNENCQQPSLNAWSDQNGQIIQVCIPNSLNTSVSAQWMNGVTLQLQQLISAVAKLSSTVTWSRSTVEELSTTVKESKSTVKELHSKVTESRQVVKELNSKVKQLNSTVTSLFSTVKKSSSTIKDFSSTVTELSSTVKKSTSTIKDFSSTVTKLSSTVKESNSTVKDLSSKVQKVYNEIGSLKASVEDVQNRSKESDAFQCTSRKDKFSFHSMFQTSTPENNSEHKPVPSHEKTFNSECAYRFGAMQLLAENASNQSSPKILRPSLIANRKNCEQIRKNNSTLNVAELSKSLVQLSKVLSVQSPKMVVESTKPVVELSKTVVGSTEPVGELSKTAVESTRPVVELSKTVVESTKPVVELSKTVIGSIKPVVEISKMVVGSTRPVVELSKTVVESTKPVVELSKTVIGSTRPVVEISKTVVQSTKPMVELSKSVVGSTKPVVELSKTVIGSTKPVVELSKTVVESTKPMVELSKSVVGSTRPVVELSKTVVEATKPVVDSSKLVVEVSKPPVDVSKPAVEEETEKSSSQHPQVKIVTTEPESMPKELGIEIMDAKMNKDSEVSQENAENNVKTNETNVEKTESVTQKYKYKEDQWSPLNPEGKRQYDRDFLLQIQFTKFCITKPNTLAEIKDVSLDKPYLRANDLAKTFEPGNTLSKPAADEHQEKNQNQNRQAHPEGNEVRVNQEHTKSDMESHETKTETTKSVTQKYKYEKDQWSPLNPEGKRQYDRDFLLQIQFTKFCITKPNTLAKIKDIVFDTPFLTTQKSPKKKKKKSLFCLTTSLEHSPKNIELLPEGGPQVGASDGMSAQSKQDSLSTESHEETVIKSVSKRSEKVKKHKADLACKPGNEEEKNSNAETNTQVGAGNGMSAQSKQESLSTESYQERVTKSVSKRSKKVKKHKADLACKPSNEKEKNSNAETNTQYSVGQRMPLKYMYTIPLGKPHQYNLQQYFNQNYPMLYQSLPVTHPQRTPSTPGPSAAPTNKMEHEPMQIVDPNMGREVTEEILHLKSTPLGGSARSTPGSSGLPGSAESSPPPSVDLPDIETTLCPESAQSSSSQRQEYVTRLPSTPGQKEEPTDEKIMVDLDIQRRMQEYLLSFSSDY